jgi:hypothetical protein
MPTQRHKWLSQAAVVGVFFAVIAIGLIYAVFHLQVVSAPSSLPEAMKPLPPPTVEEYQTEVRSVFGPFLQQAANINVLDLASIDTVFVSLIEKTEDRLLRVRVPSAQRETHLSFVMLLEKWKRAVGGSQADQKQISQATKDVATANPWLLQ